VCAAVAQEVGRLLAVDRGYVGRYDADETMAHVAAWSATAETLPVGIQTPAGAGTVAGLVRETGRAARVEYDEDSPVGRRMGIRFGVGAPITVEGSLWGIIGVASTGVEPPPVGTEERLASFGGLVATAIANAEAQAELRASRARIVASADEARRRIERDLHDGSQQRLVSLVLRLRAAREAVPAGLGGLAGELDGVMAGLDGVLDELREFSRGIHPPILAAGGLGVALRALARRSPVPVALRVGVEGRLPVAVEVGAYFVVSEALANVAGHARASAVEVGVQAVGGVLRVWVRDDGVGGARFVRGSGLVGLRDRVEALGGRIALDSAPGAGTRLEVELPLTPGAVAHRSSSPAP
jgi:signal transduction histidine kinase